MLIVLTGLPCTGKSTTADVVAAELGAQIYSVDPLEASLLRVGITREQQSDVAAYRFAFALARRQLRRGESAIVDAVNGMKFVRDAWQALADEFETSCVFIHTTCSDLDLHRSRLEARTRDIPGFVHDATWADIEAVRSSGYDESTEHSLILDAVNSREHNATEILALLESVK